MRKNFKHLIMLAMIFTTLLLTSNCKKDDDNGNLAPAAPINPTPANNDDSVSPLPTLSWSVCVDPENDSVKYDVYLGTSNPPSLITSNILINSFNPDTLIAYTKYYWKVVAKDNKNNIASSAVWNFTTAAPILTPGNLNVLVCNATQTNYFGGVEVFLYKSDADRTADPQRQNYFRKAITDNADPITKGAMFYELAYQKYYVFASFVWGGNLFIGAGDAYVPAGVTSNLIVVVN